MPFDKGNLEGSDELLEQLEAARLRIAALDVELLTLTHERMLLAGKIGQLKKSLAMPIRDNEREAKVLKRNCEIAGQLGLSQELARQLTVLLMEFAIAVQEARSTSPLIP